MENTEWVTPSYDVGQMIKAVDNISEEDFYKIYIQEVQVQMEGIKEAGSDYADYFYMTKERFDSELAKDNADSAIYWQGSWKKKTTNKLIWVVGHGQAK